MNGESKARRTSQTQYRDPYPVYLWKQYYATSLARQNPSSVVGADIFPYNIVGVINSYTVRPPHMPLGIDSVVGAGFYRTE